MAAVPHPPSPCNNMCTIDPDTGVCDGCGRTLDEISEWGWMTAEQKLAVLRRIGKDPAGGDDRDA
jgi:predicted Fe-S protein YdhL (DUF1289 family)